MGSSVLSTPLEVLFDRIALNKNFLDGLFPGNKKVQLKRLMRVLQIVSPFLEYADNKQGESPAVKTWFNGIKHAVYKADDVLDEINTDRSRIQLQHSTGNLSDSDFSDQFIGDLSPRLEEICDALETKVQQIGVLGLRSWYGLGSLNGQRKREDRPPSTPLVIQSQIVGRDDEKEKIVQILSVEGATNISLIPITGKGGVGKTTLAQLVYNDERVRNHFETRAWVCVCQEVDVFTVTKDILMKVNYSVVDVKDDLNSLQVKLKHNLEGKRFIIILDDMWNDNYCDFQRLLTPFNSGSQGSKIIVTTRFDFQGLMTPLKKESRGKNIIFTTRHKNIALTRIAPCYRLQPISYEESWSLFKLHAFDNRARTLSDEYVTIGKTIMKKCKGLPLAVKTVAAAMRSISDIREWRDILCRDNWMDVGDIMPALSLCYKLLPSHLKCCFAFCAIFPKDVPFDKREVALLWMANDLVRPSSQKVAENYFEELTLRSFFELGNNNKYLMHDLVNDLAQIVSGNFCARIEDYQLKDHRHEIQGEIDLPPEVLHFSYLSSRNESLEKFKGLPQVQGLRTFLPIHQSEEYIRITKTFFSEILPKLRHIRALSLHQYKISAIPNAVGDLKLLRLLNLSWSSIKMLPNDITKCLNLQTLILAGCWKLEELPEDMGLLINLHHLDISDCTRLTELPEDMGLLINLQHIDFRGVGFNLTGKMDSWLSKLKRYTKSIYCCR